MLKSPVSIAIDGAERTVNNLISKPLAGFDFWGVIKVNLSQTEFETRLVVEDTGKDFDHDFNPKAFEKNLTVGSHKNR